MNKTQRALIFAKYGGRCAYCGCELQKGWHVDEIEPVRRYEVDKRDERGKIIYVNNKPVTEKLVRHPERFHINNQNPSCASCNINKHSGSIEEFRKLIQGFMKHLNELNTQYKIAKRYGLVSEDIKPVIFYFEKVKSTLTQEPQSK